MKKYEVWLADLDPKFGTEAGKVRPVVIIQTNFLTGFHPSTIVCPITTNVRPGASLLRVHLQKGDASLSLDSDIMVDQIRAIDNKRFVKKLGDLPAPHRQKLDENLKVMLDLP